MKTLGTWKINLYNKSNVYQVELPFQSISITKTLNDIWTAEVQVSYFILKEWLENQNTTVEQVLTSGFKWASFLRNEVVMFNGILCEVNMDGSGEDISVTLTFKSWLSYFSRRLTSEVYTSTDAGAIAWDLIDKAQAITNGDIGITQGTIATTKDRDRTFDNDDIADSIIKMTADNVKDGFDMEISDTKVFTVSSRLGSDKPQIVFDEINLDSWSLAYTLGLNLTNRVLALGNQINTTENSSGSQQTDWYLLEGKISHLGVIETSTLQDHALAYLTENQDVRIIPSVSIVNISYEITDYDIGDSVTVKIGDIIEDLYRIKSKTIDVSDTDEKVSLEFY